MKTKPHTWLAPEDDNRRLANLCGPMNTHIAHIEQALNVKISRRGTQWQIVGDIGVFRFDVKDVVWPPLVGKTV